MRILLKQKLGSFVAIRKVKGKAATTRGTF